MNLETEKVLARVKKLLALANDDGASEGERENALRMAHNTLAKHNLSLSQVDSAAEGRGSDTLETGNAGWTVWACAGVGELFFCKYYREGKGDKLKHYFVGTPANVLTAISMSRYVITSIVREGRKMESALATDAALAGDKYAKPKKDWLPSFYTGAGEAVRDKCRELRRKAEEASKADATPGTSMVLASYYDQELRLNSQWLESQGIRLSVSAPTTNNGSGYHAGQTYGKSINLDKQVGQQNDRLRLK